MYTTLNKIREHRPCTDLWETLLKYLGKTSPDDEPLPLLTVLDSNGFDDTLWCLRAVEGFEKEKLRLGIGFAREVEHLMPTESKKSLDVFGRYANGVATQEEFEWAGMAAVDAADAAFDASAACAAYAAYVARAARTAARAAASAAARAAYAAHAAAYAARAAASGASWETAAAADSAAVAYAYAATARAADADADAAARATAAAYAAISAAARAAWLGTRSTIKAKQETQLRELLERTK